ncbi:uncharacterized protein BDW70DRAFT_132172 [Aspergillus foveolatus]|uniref:uncharacterized protein n=1 Tax=Aspergillus foveolatus TaxID=210207 RepID=UPI003CCD885A
MKLSMLNPVLARFIIGTVSQVRPGPCEGQPTFNSCTNCSDICRVERILRSHKPWSQVSLLSQYMSVLLSLVMSSARRRLPLRRRRATLLCTPHTVSLGWSKSLPFYRSRPIGLLPANVKDPVRWLPRWTVLAGALGWLPIRRA